MEENNQRSGLEIVLDDVVKIVNLICSHSKKRWMFSELLKHMEAEAMRLLYHAEVRWLSRGKVLRAQIVWIYRCKGRDVCDVFEVASKVQAFKQKLKLWQSKASTGDISDFESYTISSKLLIARLKTQTWNQKWNQLCTSISMFYYKTSKWVYFPKDIRFYCSYRL